jgi:putative effector of murein hydrolase
LENPGVDNSTTKSAREESQWEQPTYIDSTINVSHEVVNSYPHKDVKDPIGMDMMSNSLKIRAQFSAMQMMVKGTTTYIFHDIHHPNFLQQPNTNGIAGASLLSDALNDM